jgi:hypothetical protein
VTVTFILFGAPCGGSYEADSCWPPAKRIRAVHDGNGYSAVLDEPDDVPLLGESVVEYELSTYGIACGRGPHLFATYKRVGISAAEEMRAARIAASGLRAVAS